MVNEILGRNPCRASKEMAESPAVTDWFWRSFRRMISSGWLLCSWWRCRSRCRRHGILRSLTESIVCRHEKATNNNENISHNVKSLKYAPKISKGQCHDGFSQTFKII